MLYHNHLSNKYHRLWCTLSVCPDWVGHSGVTSAHFSPTACSALWLIHVANIMFNCCHYFECVTVQSNFPKKLQGKENPTKSIVAKQKPDQECDNSKLKVAKSKPSKEVKEMVSEEGKQDIKSVQPKKSQPRKKWPSIGVIKK